MSNDTDFAKFLSETRGYNYLPDKYRIASSSENFAQQTSGDVEFLISLLQLKRPEKILEIGVYHGGGTIHLLDNLDKGATLHSVDINNDAEIGHLAKAHYDERLHPQWKTFFGFDISSCIEEIGNGNDCVILDTTHQLPGKFLAI